MNLVIWAWALSLAGAALFFIAGGLWATRRGTLQLEREHALHEGDAAALKRAREECAELRASLNSLEHGPLAEAQIERDRLRADRSHAKQAVRAANARAERAQRDVDELLAELRKPRSQRPSGPMVVDANVRGEALRSILDQETRGNAFTGAVIADEMGLIVASTGEYGDALAAYGAFLAGVGAKTRNELPLHELRQLVIQDDHDTTLTVRPIASAEDHLALVTLFQARPGSTHTGASMESPS